MCTTACVHILDVEDGCYICVSEGELSPKNFEITKIEMIYYSINCMF